MLQDKLAKKTRTKNKAPKKPAMKKMNTTELFALNDNELEVELDSLGHFFIHLIDDENSQDDAEGSQTNVEEVTILSFDSEPLTRQKVRQASQKS